MKYRIRDAFHWRFIKRNLIDFIEGFLPADTPISVDKNKKRILIFNWRDTKHKFAGGAEVYIHELAKRWAHDGHYVTIFCGNDSLSPRSEVVDGVHIVRRGGFYFVYVWAFLYYMLHFRGKYDVIIDSQNGIPFFTPLYAKEPVYSLLFHVHQEVFRQSLVKPLADIASFLERTAMPRIYRETPFLTISQSTQKEMTRLKLGQKGITIIYPGVNLNQLVPAEKSERPLVLYLGRLKYYKRVDVLLHAAAEVVSKHPDVRFVIAGDGEYKKNLKKITKRLGLEENVDFIGKVTEEEKAALYAKAWIVVNPSMMEGWGITTIEANACGTPVIASNVPGLHDSVKDEYNGLLFTLGSHQELAEKINLLLSHQYLRVMMSKNARGWASRFDWKISAAKCLRVIDGTKAVKTVSIGIPAFNEERNIKTIISSLLAQQENGFVLKEIVIASDGSSDETVTRARSISDQRIRIVEDAQRLGKSARINQLLSEMKSDIVFLVDADIKVDDNQLLAKVINDSDLSRTGLVAVRAEPMPGRTFFEKCINHSVALQNDVRKKWNHGDNYLSFRGCFLAMTQSLAKELRLDETVVNNDAYMYYYAKEKGYLPRYIDSLFVYYRSPATFSDHIKQSSRFQYSASELENRFSGAIRAQYRMPRRIILSTSAKHFAKNPALFTGYMGIYLRAKMAKTQNLKSTWSIAVSTKSKVQI